MISKPYHIRLPETAHGVFLFLYTLFGLFIVLVAGLITWGGVMVLQKPSDSQDDFFLGIAILVLFGMMVIYGLFILYRVWKLARNKQRLLILKQKIAQNPIPIRRQPEKSFTWQTWWTQTDVLDWVEKIDSFLKDKTNGILLLAGVILLIYFDYLSFWQMICGLWFIYHIFLHLKHKIAHFSIQIQYEHLRDILILKQLDDKKQWQEKSFYLQNYIGICTVWQPENHLYLLQFINKQYEAELLMSNLNALEKITQKIACATGLPILQENPLKAKT